MGKEGGRGQGVRSHTLPAIVSQESERTERAVNSDRIHCGGLLRLFSGGLLQPYSGIKTNYPEFHVANRVMKFRLGGDLLFRCERATV